MLYVNEFIAGEIVAAYITDEVPQGTVVGRRGNAVLLRDGDREILIRLYMNVEGDIIDYIPEAACAPVVDLPEYVLRRTVRLSIRNWI